MPPCPSRRSRRYFSSNTWPTYASSPVITPPSYRIFARPTPRRAEILSSCCLNRGRDERFKSVGDNLLDKSTQSHCIIDALKGNHQAFTTPKPTLTRSSPQNCRARRRVEQNRHYP